MDLEKQLLSDYGNKRPFKVSDGYFDNLSERIMEHISIDAGNVEQTHKKNIKLIRFFLALVRKAERFAYLFYFQKRLHRPTIHVSNTWEANQNE